MGDLISRSALIAKIKPPTEGDYTHAIPLGNVRKMLLNFANSVPAVEFEPVRYTAHEVAEIIAELFGDECACNFNGIDEWLPDKCELTDACPQVFGVACWEQYLKYRDMREVKDD